MSYLFGVLQPTLVPGAAAGLQWSMTPAIPPSCELEWAQLLEQCWQPAPEDRPSLHVLADMLQRIIDQCKAEEQVRRPSLHPLHNAASSGAAYDCSTKRGP